jgi:drug/metabolite transporter (DMT)-like permease
MFSRGLLLVFGIFCGSTAVIMIKAGDEHPFLVASYRLLVAAVVLFPFFWRDLRSYPGKYGWRQVGWSALPALALAIHFMSWIVGARLTFVTNASLIANLTPVAMPFFLWAVYQEKVNRQEILGTLLTLSGLVVLAAGNLQLSATHFYGDLICFGSMLAFAAYLALGRRNSHRLSLWLYMVPLYAMAGLICLACALPFINPIKDYTVKNVLLILGLGLIPTVLGYTILNYSMKFFRGQVVSVTNLAQLLFAGLLGYLIFREQPQVIFYPSAALILAGVIVVLSSGYRKRPQNGEAQADQPS